MPHEVETMFWVGRHAPWHGLGVNVAEAPTAQDALRAAGLEWEVRSLPVYIRQPGSSEYTEVPGWRANVRDSDWSTLGIVSEGYSVVQPFEAFDFLDQVVGSGDVRYETAGSLFRGRKIWILARMTEGAKDVLGDPLAPYVLFTNSYDGSSAVRCLTTPVRVVCNNTLNMALGNYQRIWSIRHVGNISGKVRDAQDALGMAHHYLDALQEDAEVLQQKKVDEEAWRHIVTQLIPEPPDATERVEMRIYNERVALEDLINAPDLQRFRGTGWAAINAVSDWVAHAPPRRATETWRDRRMELVTEGAPMLDQAHDLIMAL